MLLTAGCSVYSTLQGNFMQASRLHKRTYTTTIGKVVPDLRGGVCRKVGHEWEDRLRDEAGEGIGACLFLEFLLLLLRGNDHTFTCT